MSRLREFALKILLRKEKGIMAVIYATLIVKGKKTLDQVPALIRKQVEEILKDLEVEVECSVSRKNNQRVEVSE